MRGDRPASSLALKWTPTVRRTRPLRRRILIAVAGFGVRGSMCGIGLRAWELAQVLAHDFEVVIVSRYPSDLSWPGIEFRTYDDDAWREDVEASDAVISYDMPDTRLLLHARAVGAQIIVENSVPVEQLEYDFVRDAEDPDEAYARVCAGFKLQVLLADQFLIRAPVERVSVITALCLVGRLERSTYHDAPGLQRLLTRLPIGFNSHSDRHATQASTGVAVDWMWSGGVWRFYRPDLALAARDLLEKQGSPTSMRFLYGTGTDAAPGEGVIPSAPTHYERDVHLKGARALICLGGDGIENQTCLRLRLRDTFLYSKPLVIDGHGATGELVERLQIGRVAAASHPAAVASAMSELLRPEVYAACVQHIERVRSKYLIDPYVRPLTEWVKSGALSSDTDSRQRKSAIDRLVAEYPGLSDSAWYPFEEQVPTVMTAAQATE